MSEIVDKTDRATDKFDQSYSIQLVSDSAVFRIDFSGDSLMISGNMQMSVAAKEFIDFCRKYIKTKIDSLELENEYLRKLCIKNKYKLY